MALLKPASMSRPSSPSSLTTPAGHRQQSGYRALVRLFDYLAEEGEITDSPMARMKRHYPHQQVPIVTSDDLRKLLAAADGESGIAFSLPIYGCKRRCVGRLDARMSGCALS
jgi:hypothetical protein